MPIRVLDRELVARIAAGEVVDRPASVVKELVENSLDAGSSHISVEVRGGGVGLIRVIDNGAGISPVEVELAFERYATSKLSRREDLESISSLGFRGEALPSIAAVAEVEMVTATAGGSSGAYISLQDGAIASRKSRGRSPGTTVSVRNLFRQVPARLKFLKSPATENSHIANVVSQYALCFPEVKFTLLLEGRVTLRTPGSGQLIDSVIAIYGSEVARNMLGIEGAPSSPGVTGMVGTPSVSRSSRGYLSFFVNRRWITSRLLARAVAEAYHGLLMTGRYPVAVINLNLPLPQVDVNIHPTKTEVKFQQEQPVFSTVQRAVRQTLVGQMPVPRIETPTTLRGEPVALPWTPAGTGHVAPPLLAAEKPAPSLPVLRVLGQLASSYIVGEGSDGLYLIDQHAAHERILFERIKRQRAKQAVESQGLLPPVTLDVSPRQEAVLKLRHQSLDEFGFSIEPFGERTYLVRAVPALLHNKDWAGMLTELLDSPEREGDWAESTMVTLSCHSAVRAGQALTDGEMREMLRQLEETATPQTCPHGRPAMIHLGYGQLQREFGRR